MEASDRVLQIVTATRGQGKLVDDRCLCIAWPRQAVYGSIRLESSFAEEEA